MTIMDTPTRRMGFERRMQMIWIDAVLTDQGHINRSDLKAAFYINEQTASAVLGDFLALYPDRMTYDSRARRYQAQGAPLFRLFARLDARRAVLAASQLFTHARFGVRGAA